MAYINRYLICIVIFTMLVALATSRSISNDEDDNLDMAEQQFTLREIMDALLGNAEFDSSLHF